VTSDEDLMATAAQGDLNAFEQIVLRHQALVWRVAYRLVGNPADAQDIAQIVFLKLFEAAPRYRPTARFKTYLFRIVTTTCIDHARKNRPSTTGNPIDVSDDSPLAIDAVIKHENESGVKKAIEALPLRQRSVIALRYEAELSVREIADILKVTEKAVERLLAHARDTLSTVLRNKWA
jgi:RNA polymerase sigma-70 factor, ECF subfamily